MEENRRTPIFDLRNVKNGQLRQDRKVIWPTKAKLKGDPAKARSKDDPVS